MQKNFQCQHGTTNISHLEIARDYFSSKKHMCQNHFLERAYVVQYFL